MLCADMVEIRWKDRAGRQHGATALLEDISSSGACLQLEEAVPLGVEIAWEAAEQFFSGYVRYCVYREIGYFVGVEFSRSSQWSKLAYEPRHLLDLEKLVAAVKKKGGSKAAASAPTKLRE
ncbi:MAG: hypothetical protein KGN36_11040 [Acidobacteriota bacterium]|nr:hypothetical protein [Acidobacteriota bacterium]